MWKPFLYQHIVGGIIFIIGYLLYFSKTDKTLIRAQGRSIVFYPLVAFVFYFLINLFWMLWATGE